ncbi:MAG: hypothetical protein QE265_12455 [Rhodoferax sp.]|nr:hypothetical protein [Rhodoferax sp.]
MSIVRAKFKVESLTKSESGSSIKLRPVTGGSPENEKFFKYTPFGEINIGTVNPKAAAQFEPGNEFFVDFTKAE